MKAKKSLKKGFTLIEVILVVAIITIISAIAVPQVGKYLDKANRSKVIGAIAELNNSSTSWSIDHGGEVYAKIDSDSKAFPGEEIRK